ncbi:hypothetical protein SAMN05216388_100966 [Halorientalis persicus]|uniref:Uncharacterized protein n=1 Tax=Halorientalis persicus TaxID=1367881 RepID=A0A1H8MNZ5_9EURY|nr:hypothetical protein [Halorientalis persicus]SEO18978.1 hypothetical protein SAMN05216388_100966 [Halorientalis persicus]
MAHKSRSRSSTSTVDGSRSDAPDRDGDAPDEDDEQAQLDRAEFRADAQADIAEAAAEDDTDAAERSGHSPEDVDSPYAEGWDKHQAARSRENGGEIEISNTGHAPAPDRDAGTAKTARRDYRENMLSDEPLEPQDPNVELVISREQEQDRGGGSPADRMAAQDPSFGESGYGLGIDDAEQVFAAPDVEEMLKPETESLAGALPSDIDKPSWTRAKQEEALGKQKLELKRRATAATVADADHDRAVAARDEIVDDTRTNRAEREERLVEPEPDWDTDDWIEPVADVVDPEPDPVSAQIDPAELQSTAELLTEQFPSLEEDQAGQILYEMAQSGIDPQRGAMILSERRGSLRIPDTVVPLEGLSSQDKWGKSPSDGSPKVRGEVVGAFEPNDPDTQHQVLVIQDQWGGRSKVTLFNGSKESDAGAPSFSGGRATGFDIGREEDASGLVEGERYKKGDVIELENFVTSELGATTTSESGGPAERTHTTGRVAVVATSNTTVRRVEAGDADTPTAPTGFGGNSVRSFKSSGSNWSKPQTQESGSWAMASNPDYSDTSRALRRRERKSKKEGRISGRTLLADEAEESGTDTDVDDPHHNMA